MSTFDQNIHCEEVYTEEAAFYAARREAETVSDADMEDAATFFESIIPHTPDEDEGPEPLDFEDYYPEDHFRDDVEADADVLRMAGWGTDEDYGYYGHDEWM